MWDQIGNDSGWAGASHICYDNNCYSLTADDFICYGEPQFQYITDIEFYGWSAYGENNYVDAFRITFWTDVPASPEDESHPGDLLYDCEVGYQYLGDNHFKINLPEDCWFDQGVGEEKILWIGIQGVMTTDGYPDYFYWGFRHWDDPEILDDAAFEATCWNYPPWYNWGWQGPDAVGLYDGPFPDNWYASANMRFALTAIPEPASLCLLGLGMLLLRRR
jgi:hypothetical protein